MKLKSLFLILIASSTITTQSECSEISGKTVAFAAFTSLILAKIVYDLYYHPIDDAKKIKEDCMCCNNNDSENTDEDDSWRKHNSVTPEKKEAENIIENSQDDIWRDRFCQIGDVFNG